MGLEAAGLLSQRGGERFVAGMFPTPTGAAGSSASGRVLWAMPNRSTLNSSETELFNNVLLYGFPQVARRFEKEGRLVVGYTTCSCSTNREKTPWRPGTR